MSTIISLRQSLAIFIDLIILLYLKNSKVASLGHLMKSCTYLDTKSLERDNYEWSED